MKGLGSSFHETIQPRDGHSTRQNYTLEHGEKVCPAMEAGGDASPTPTLRDRDDYALHQYSEGSLH
ncbi:hypothetical protein EPI10_016393 [Gossypium australe]|uniref:Uncharacterized protein n=1 Tax=Gossypium australe TaxID=47621 RepID=A0A5B6VNL1_9ROSI|nr:hypothetical protein EPI10_016393 [Gossypium australe]